MIYQEFERGELWKYGVSLSPLKISRMVPTDMKVVNEISLLKKRGRHKTIDRGGVSTIIVVGKVL